MPLMSNLNFKTSPLPSMTKNPHLHYSTPKKPFNSTIEICQTFPPYVNSEGLWLKTTDRRWWLNNSLPYLQFHLILIFSSFAFVHFLLKRVGVPRITSQIIGGIILGCSLRMIGSNGFQMFTKDSEDILGLLGYFGFVLYMFMTAIKIDVTLSMKAGRKSLIIALPFIFVPLIGGLVAQTFFHEILTKVQILTTIFLVCHHSLTSLPIISTLISELDILNSELGRLCLSSTMIGEMVCAMTLLLVKIIYGYQQGTRAGFVQSGSLIVLLVVLVFVFRPAMHWIVKQTPKGKPVKPMYVQGITFLAIASIVLCALLDQSTIVGPYLLGLAVPDGAPLGSSMVDTLECFVLDLLFPILSAICALRVDPKLMATSFQTAFTKINVILFFVVLTMKMISCFLSSLYCNLPFKDSLALSLIMSCKGIVEIAVYCLLRDKNIISDDGFLGWLITLVTLVATFVPIGLRRLRGHLKKQIGYQNMNIMLLKPESELRVIACIYRNENILGTIHLLNLSCPTTKNPLAVYVLHLIELIGRTAPVFISHSLQKKSSDDISYSQNVICSLDHFKRNHCGKVYVECFTSISHTKFMSDDLCKLALDKITSLMILPFHRTWAAGGIIDQDDKVVRALNCCMLNRAPCSVGIFVDRGHLGRAASTVSVELEYKYSICVIFLGGNDDREALSYAKRMVKDSRIKLTILRLVSPFPVEDGSSKWEDLFDTKFLQNFESKCFGHENVKYVEEVCEDGPQTALKLRQMVNKYDLMIVGRRSNINSLQTSGLSEWSEFPELGVLGDLIVSIDINYKTSVLVIQQQKIKQNSSF